MMLHTCRSVDVETFNNMWTFYSFSAADLSSVCLCGWHFSRNGFLLYTALVSRNITRESFNQFLQLSVIHWPIYSWTSTYTDYVNFSWKCVIKSHNSYVPSWVPARSLVAHVDWHDDISWCGRCINEWRHEMAGKFERAMLDPNIGSAVGDVLLSPRVYWRFPLPKARV